MAPEKHIGSHGAVLFLVLSAALWGQSAAPLEFEVVSIKPSPPPDFPGGGYRSVGCRGGPGSNDPGLIHCSHMSARSLAPMAFDVTFTRVSYAESAGGEPPMFEIDAKVPRGATKEDVRGMWQKLLADRFKLAAHRETREVPVYELVVAKGALKAKEWADRPADPNAATWEPGTPPKRDKEGFPRIPPGQTIGFYTGGKAWFVAPAGTMHDLATMLEGRLSMNPGAPRPVIDGTGLSGKYDLKFWWSPTADNPKPNTDEPDGPSMLSALESQLGLKVQPKKSAPVEMLIIDHIEKTPTEN